MDHKEEQTNEIEALDSIYCGEMEILSLEPYHIFVIPVKSDDYDEDSSAGISCRLRFEYTPNYPEEPPIIDIEDTVGLEDDDEQTLRHHLQEQVIENLGMVMVFTLVSAAQEWLNSQSDIRRKIAEMQEEKRIRDEEEAERKRFEGTRVTVESFLVWKKAFDLEFGIDNKKVLDEKNKKLTGRELFLSDKSLNESDLKFLEVEGGEVVKVDESLFQDLDELDIEDEELECNDD
ncbi:RWD domain-containing protein 1 [Macrosteles quadrilineatus]|uniref:RWD domain-containing protein 1 n=1 Tax=Macrosteles quadrilineatus TaxID=74068 RepID=UPI0023E0C59D|nr:RWD domain-containing protein 1 [Macrosteles quadrilineatus]